MMIFVISTATLPVSALRAGKYQPRTRMDEGALNELADSIRAQGLPAEAAGSEVILAVTETNLDTDVRRGENSGRKLRHTGVARTFLVVGRAEAADGGAGFFGATGATGPFGVAVAFGKFIPKFAFKLLIDDLYAPSLQPARCGL